MIQFRRAADFAPARLVIPRLRLILGALLVVSAALSAFSWRGLLAVSAAASVFGLAAIGGAAVGSVSAKPAATGDLAIRPFRVSIPDAAIADMRLRILATRWLERRRSPKRAVISQRGDSRSSFPRRSEPRFDRSADRSKREEIKP